MNSLPPPVEETARYAPEGTRVATVSLLILAVLVLAVICAVLTGGLLRAYAGAGAPHWVHPPDTPGPAAHWVDPTVDLATTRQRERARLHGYDWLDRDHGVVRIPIERAMELTAQRGLRLTPATAPATSPTSAETP